MRESEAGGFAFERLDVYPRAIEFLVVVARVISELPGGNASLTDQLRRAALSVPVSVAEGVGVRASPIAVATTQSLAAPRWNVPQFSMPVGFCNLRARNCSRMAVRFCSVSSRG